jgi:hypothetical protein
LNLEKKNYSEVLNFLRTWTRSEKKIAMVRSQTNDCYLGPKGLAKMSSANIISHKILYSEAAPDSNEIEELRTF